MKYDDNSIESILYHAKKLIGKSIEDVISSSQTKVTINLKNKGSIGNIIEESWFGIKNNNSPLPDFSEVGIELKVIPLTKQRNRLVVKERTKICSINYQELISENWETSHAKEKLNKILFIYYLYDAKNIRESTVKKIDLWQLNQNHNEMIIQNDWLIVQQKVHEGYAHKLSERDSKILAASRSGQGGKDKDGNLRDLVQQPIKKYEDEALKRAFSLKQSFTNQHWIQISTKTKYESIIDTLQLNSLEDFETIILEKLHTLSGKSIQTLSEEYDIKIGNGKNRVATLMKKVIGFKSVQSKIKEFEQLGIIIKMVNIRKKDNFPCEAISFPAMKLIEFIDEKWEESALKEMFYKILFIPIYKEKCDVNELEKHIIGKSFFWSPSPVEEAIIKQEWQNYQNEVKNGKCKTTRIIQNSKRGYKEVTSLSKESETNIIHIRPHGKNSNDRDIDGFGNTLVKQSFWLNKKFIQQLLNN